MELVIGGAYQGKRAWAKEAYGLADRDVFVCEGLAVDYSRRCACHLERFALACTRAGLDPRRVWDFEAARDMVLLADDVSCGVVPVDETVRAWREDTGRFLTELAARSARVTRVFCGLPLRLKG